MPTSMEDPFQIVRSEVTSNSAGPSIKELFFKYVRFLPLIILSVGAALFGGYIYLRYVIPVYHSEGSLVINGDDNGSNNNNDQFERLFGGGSKNIANEIELMRSKPLMSKVVEDLNLNFTYYLKGKIKDENRYNKSSFKVEPVSVADPNSFFSLKINFGSNGFTVNDGKDTLSFGQVFKNLQGTFRLTQDSSFQDLTGQEYSVVWQPTGVIASSLINNLLIAPKGPTGILIISLDAGSPQMAADVINQLMKEYQVVTIEYKNETTKQIIRFIDSRLIVVSRELDSINHQLLAYQISNNMINSDAQSSLYFNKQTETDDAITTQQAQISVLQLIDDYLSNQQNAFDLVPSTLGINDATLTSIIAAYNAAVLERKNMLDANVPETNLRVKQAEDRIERLRNSVFENLRNLRNSYVASIQRLQQRNSLAKAQLQSLPAKEQALQDIRKEQQAKQELYNLLSGKREESAISLAGTISNTKIVDTALPNGTPVKPNRKSVQLISLLIGLALPIAIIVIIEVLNDKVTSRTDVEKLTTVPIVGEVGHSFSNNFLVVKTNTRSVIAEQFRIIRSNLQFFLTNLSKPVILVTSSFSGEGKSFISSNLGTVMSLANKKTIVLEFDIRKPKILSQIGIGKKPGLTNFLLGEVNLEELPIQVTGLDNLYVLACGPVPPNPSELLLEPRLNDLFAYLKQQFDVVIIDTSPIGIVSDAMALSRFADCTLYIVRQGHTYKKQLGLIDEYQRDGKLPRPSIILNDVKVQAGYGYGYGRYNYGYSYGYGSSYFDEEAPPKNLLQRLFGRKQKRKTNQA